MPVAQTVAQKRQDRAQFEKLLRQALEVPTGKVREQRLTNVLAQRRAEWLLGRLDILFIE